MLIIFDCDGVLVDSELLANQVLADYLTGLGFPHTREECTQNFVGKSMPSIIRMIEEETSQKLPGDFCEELLRRDKSAFKGRLQAIPGVADVVVSWTGPKCVASSSSFERIYNSLRNTKLLIYFEPYIWDVSDNTVGAGYSISDGSSDGICSRYAGETSANSDDCDDICGDGVCNGSENFVNCQTDCESAADDGFCNLYAGVDTLLE